MDDNNFQDVAASECVPVQNSSEERGKTLYEEMQEKGEFKPVQPIPHNQLADKESDEE